MINGDHWTVEPSKSLHVLHLGLLGHGRVLLDGQLVRGEARVSELPLDPLAHPGLHQRHEELDHLVEHLLLLVILLPQAYHLALQPFM